MKNFFAAFVVHPVPLNRKNIIVQSMEHSRLNRFCTINMSEIEEKTFTIF